MSSIDSFSPDPVIRIYPALPRLEENKTTTVFKHATKFLSDTWDGLSSSRILRAIVFGAIAFGAVAAVAYLALTPPGWITTAVIVGGFALAGFLSGGSCSLAPKDVLQDVAYELGTVKRLTRFSYDEIAWEGKPDPGRIFLGPMPNRMSIKNSPEAIAQREHLNAVLSINAPGSIDEKGERGCYGLMLASAPTDWQQQSVSYAEIDLPDHTPLSIDELDAAADYIHSIVKNGGNIYVHCKAGRSRSAMAVAAYMIKYGHLKTGEAVSILRSCRPLSKAHKKEKAQRLQEFENFCAARPNPEMESIHLQRAYHSADPFKCCFCC